MRVLARSRIVGTQVAELAGIMGAKYTCFLIPLCHNISLKCARTDLPCICEFEVLSLAAHMCLCQHAQQ